MIENSSVQQKKSFISRMAALPRALLFVPLLQQIHSIDASPAADPHSRLEEAKGLARAIHLDIVAAQFCPVNRPDPATLFGKGRVAEIASFVAAEQIALVIIDHALTPVQQRNLEKAWNCKVIDRTALILEIFGERARTKEGALQVELAHLNYQKGRLVRSWTHLERQRGGSGFLGGPGETQIEADRRVLQEKINRIKRELAKTVKTRSLHRSKRQKAPYPVIALVGYTNAGKSTLFNRMTGADVLAEDMLFATLDPTLRRIQPPFAGEGADAAAKTGKNGSGQTLILSDTVGFIAHLPTHLIAAFRATLEEVTEADLILHIRDMADADNAVHKHNVTEILASLGIDTDRPDTLIEVWNKMDMLPPERRYYLENQAKTALLPTVPISARSGWNVDRLFALIAQKAFGNRRIAAVRLLPREFSLLDWLYRHGEQRSRAYAENGDILLKIALSKADKQAFDSLRRKLAAEQHAENSANNRTL